MKNYLELGALLILIIIFITNVSTPKDIGCHFSSTSLEANGTIENMLDLLRSCGGLEPLGGLGSGFAATLTKNNTSSIEQSINATKSASITNATPNTTTLRNLTTSTNESKIKNLTIATDLPTPKNEVTTKPPSYEELLPVTIHLHEPQPVESQVGSGFAESIKWDRIINNSTSKTNSVVTMPPLNDDQFSNDPFGSGFAPSLAHKLADNIKMNNSTNETISDNNMPVGSGFAPSVAENRTINKSTSS